MKVESNTGSGDLISGWLPIPHFRYSFRKLTAKILAFAFDLGY
jgi:hypothetical protein